MREYMERLRARGELLEVRREVNAKHELAAVTQAAQRRWNKPVLFHKVTGTPLPVLTNIYGSRQRLAEILGIGPLDFCRQWSRLTNLGAAPDYPLKRSVPVPGDLVDCSLSELPLLTYSERDGAPYFTSAMFIAKEPETGVPNLSFHRSMYVSDRELRCRLAPRHHLTLYHEKAEKMGKPLEAAMLIGPPPTTFLAAAAPVPYDVDELEVAAKLAKRPLDMRPSKHIDLMVPAATEIVIEGRFLPNERRPEGPFGEFMGYYVPVGPNAVFEVLGVTRRRDAIFHSILCGSSEEVLTLELSVAANIYQRVSEVLPGIFDVTCQPFAPRGGEDPAAIRGACAPGHARGHGSRADLGEDVHGGGRGRRHLRHERRDVGDHDPLAARSRRDHHSGDADLLPRSAPGPLGPHGDRRDGPLRAARRVRAQAHSGC